MGDQSFDDVAAEVEQPLVDAQSPRTSEPQGAEDQWGQACFTGGFRLLDLPEEIQRQILALVLTVQVEEARHDGLGGEETVLVLPHAEPRYERDVGVFEGDRRMPIYSGLMQHWQHLGVPRERLAVLTVSRHFYEHGSAALYGLYRFRTYCSEAFRVLFTKHIGAANTANIKSLTMGLPHALKTMPSKYLGRYLYLLSVGMPKLNQLKVTTKFGRWYYPTTYQPAHPWVECHRGMLWFASWVTLRHEGLKFAVWDERNTVWGNKIEADKATWFDNRIVELCVTITRYKPKSLQSMIDSRYLELENAELDLKTDSAASNESSQAANDAYHAYINDPYAPFDALYSRPVEPSPHHQARIVLPASRLLLDSARIRRTGFFGLSNKQSCRPYRFQLPPHEGNSEANAPNCDKEEDLIENHLMYRQYPELILSHPMFRKSNMNGLYLRAKALERINVQREMIAKNGPLDPEPTAHGDDSDTNDDDGEDGAEDGQDHDGHDDDGHNISGDEGDDSNHKTDDESQDEDSDADGDTGDQSDSEHDD